MSTRMCQTDHGSIAEKRKYISSGSLPTAFSARRTDLATSTGLVSWSSTPSRIKTVRAPRAFQTTSLGSFFRHALSIRVFNQIDKVNDRRNKVTLKGTMVSGCRTAGVTYRPIGASCNLGPSVLIQAPRADMILLICAFGRSSVAPAGTCSSYNSPPGIFPENMGVAGKMSLISID